MKKSLKLISAALAATISMSTAPVALANPPKSGQSVQNSQENSVIRIFSVEDVKHLRDLAHSGENFEGKTIILENNLYVSEDEIKSTKLDKLNPIFSKNDAFNGTFDGNGKTLQFHTTSSNIFGVIGEDGIVKNLNITGRFEGNLDGGIVAMFNFGTIDNCHLNVIAKCTNSKFIDMCSNSIKETTNDCYINGIDKFPDPCVIGICSMNIEKGVIKNCSVEGDFSTYAMDCAGICAINDGTIDSCKVSGKFTNSARIFYKDNKPLLNPETSAVALSNNGRISNCHVEADLINEYAGKLTGIAGGIVSINRGLIENSTFKGSVSAAVAGPITGLNCGTVKLCKLLK